MKATLPPKPPEYPFFVGSPSGGRDQGLDESFKHLARLIVKYERLQAAIDDSYSYIESALWRLSADLTPSQKVALWRWTHHLPIQSARKRMADAVRVANPILARWAKEPPEEQPSGFFKGTFPLDYQPTPPRSTPCVYLLLVGPTVVYIGWSESIRNRLRTHWNQRRARYDGWQIHACVDPVAARSLEADLIFQHKPHLNLTGRNKRLRVVG